MHTLSYYFEQLFIKKRQLHQLLIEASHALNDFYLDPATWNVALKEDASPVTTADHHCHELLCKKLAALGLNIPIISEENTESEMKLFRENPPPVYWLIDPLDGTSGFVKGTGHFAVNVALVYNTKAIAGWIAWPRIGLVCWAYGDQYFDAGSFSFPVKQPENIDYLLQLRQKHSVVVYSSSTTNHRKQRVVHAIEPLLADAATVSLGAAVKFCAMFKGYGDLYPRLGGTCLWDLAAGQVLLRARGGDIFCLDGSPMIYEFEKSILNPVFVAVSDIRFSLLPALLDELSELYQEFKQQDLSSGKSCQ